MLFFRYEKEHPTWNVDNMSEDKHNRTIINKDKPKGPVTEESQANDLSDFFKKNDKEVKQFGMLSKYEESHKFIKDRMHLMCEHLGSFVRICPFPPFATPPPLLLSFPPTPAPALRPFPHLRFFLGPGSGP